MEKTCRPSSLPVLALSLTASVPLAGDLPGTRAFPPGTSAAAVAGFNPAADARHTRGFMVALVLKDGDERQGRERNPAIHPAEERREKIQHLDLPKTESLPPQDLAVQPPRPSPDAVERDHRQNAEARLFAQRNELFASIAPAVAQDLVQGSV